MQHEARPSVEVAATLLEGLCYSNKSVLSTFLPATLLLTHFVPRRDRLSAGIIVAGWDKETGGSVYNIPLGGGLFKGPWAIGGEWLWLLIGVGAGEDGREVEGPRASTDGNVRGDDEMRGQARGQARGLQQGDRESELQWGVRWDMRRLLHRFSEVNSKMRPRICDQATHTNPLPPFLPGSGSTYIYGYCDATFREDWGRDETVEFVRNGAYPPSSPLPFLFAHKLTKLLNSSTSSCPRHVPRRLFGRNDPYGHHPGIGRRAYLRSRGPASQCVSHVLPSSQLLCRS